VCARGREKKDEGSATRTPLRLSFPLSALLYCSGLQQIPYTKNKITVAKFGLRFDIAEQWIANA
jgi:hypothetical protein